MKSFYFWPENSKNIEDDLEVVLLIKTLSSKYDVIEEEILKMHSYENPCIFGINTFKISENYEKYLKSKIN